MECHLLSAINCTLAIVSLFNLGKKMSYLLGFGKTSKVYYLLFFANAACWNQPELLRTPCAQACRSFVWKQKSILDPSPQIKSPNKYYTKSKRKDQYVTRKFLSWHITQYDSCPVCYIHLLDSGFVHSHAFVCFYCQGIQGPVGPQVFNACSHYCC